jgi:DNA repair exonuclease SbcCD nuclease subunit
MADIHLGNRQYGSEERQMDFAQAFLNAIKYAVKEKVDFILISGDLFHKKTEMDPVTLLQASKVLEIPKKADIPVIAIEGNHDSTYFRENYSWMDYLAINGLIINLKPSFNDGIVLEEWDGEKGAYIDLNGVRIYGMKYYGSITERIMDEYLKKIKPGEFTIFMAHIGVEGYVNNMYGCIPSSKLHRLSKKVDYIALGHVHKSFVERDLIFNPGSLEVCDVTELDFERGMFLVDVMDKVKYSLVRNFHRPRKFLTLKYRMKSADLKDFKHFIESKAEENPEGNSKPVIDLKVEIDRSLRHHVDDMKLKEIIHTFFDPLLVRIQWDVRDFFRATMVDTTSRESIERSVIEQLLHNYPYGNISPEILKLKGIFSGSFDLNQVDRLVEDILNSQTEKLVEVKPEKGKPEKPKKEKEELEFKEGQDGLKSEEPKSEESSQTEEVWDWRRACDKGSRIRKRKKL